MISIHNIHNDVSEELISARGRFEALKSYHEAFAVIKEELDEFWEQVRKWPKNHDVYKMRKELILKSLLICLLIGFFFSCMIRYRIEYIPQNEPIQIETEKSAAISFKKVLFQIHPGTKVGETNPHERSSKPIYWQTSISVADEQNNLASTSNCFSVYKHCFKKCIDESIPYNFS